MKDLFVLDKEEKEFLHGDVNGSFSGHFKKRCRHSRAHSFFASTQKEDVHVRISLQFISIRHEISRVCIARHFLPLFQVHRVPDMTLDGCGASVI